MKKLLILLILFSCNSEKKADQTSFEFSPTVKILKRNSKRFDNWKLNYADIANGIMPSDTIGKSDKGGSFLCEPDWCHGCRASGHSFTSPKTSLMHVGFRCVKQIIS